jgi:tetratricopeptide (TPR) repeat protein
VQEGREALNRALDLAGDDADFYFETADALANGEIWVEAAHLYLEGILRFHRDDVPRVLRDRLGEATFWAAEQREAEKDIPIPRIAEVDPSLERVIKARYEYYHGDMIEAETLVEEVLAEINPGMPEAMLLQAEMFYDWGEVDFAFSILYELLERDDVPNWIKHSIELQLEDAQNQAEEAQRQIEENPDDPWGYLALYDAYLMLGLYDEAEAAAQQALELANEDHEVLEAVGDIAAAHGSWLQAARFYAQSVRVAPRLAGPELNDKLLSALYYGSTEEGALNFLSEIEIDLPGREDGVNRLFFRDTLIARYKLYYEDIEEAEKIITEIVETAPNFDLARLVEAEVHLFKGDIDQSRLILQELERKPNISPWMQDEVQFMLQFTNQ